MIKIGKNISKFSKYSCRPTSKSELQDIIKSRTKKEGNNCNLNDIDVSLIEDMSYLFEQSKFKGNISEWNVSKVKIMMGMFYESDFNSDISNWNVSKVKNMSGMFYKSRFNQDISDWNIGNSVNLNKMFFGCPIKEEFKLKPLSC